MKHLAVAFVILIGCRDDTTAPYDPCGELGDACDDDGFCQADEKGSACLPHCTAQCPSLEGVEATCVASRCFLYCKGDSGCPDGMICSIVAPETSGICEWPK